MNLDDILDAYEAVRKRHGLAKLESAALQVTALEESRAEDAWEALRAFQPLEGWLQFQSRTEVFLNGMLPDPVEGWGRLLDAEATDADHRSWHLRALSPGLLRLTIATPLPAGTGDETLLADDVQQLATGKSGHRYLCYRRYWRLDKETGAIPVFAAFQGFSHLVKED